MLLARHDTPADRAFTRHADLQRISQQGPATPDHVIRTKRLPMLGRDVEAYAEAYRAYFAEHASGARTPVQMLDPAPRVILDAELGLVTVGKSAGEAAINTDIYHHTMEIVKWP